MDELNQNDPAFIAALMRAVEAGGDVHYQQFARLTGTDERTVRRAWTDGRLPASPPDAIPMREGVVALVSGGGLRKRGIPQFLFTADARARELLGLPPRESTDTGGRDLLVEKLKLSYLAAKTEATKAQAERAKLEADIKKGVYVPRAEVELDAATTATQISVALMQMPSRLAGMCAGLPAEKIAEIVREEVEQVVKTIQLAAFTGDWS